MNAPTATATPAADSRPPDSPATTSTVTTSRAGTSRLHAVVVAVTLLVILASAVVGGDPFGIRERLWSGSAPVPAPAGSPWQGVVALEGTGSTVAAAFEIGPQTAEWRVKWTCHVGHLLVQEGPAAQPVIDTACPTTGTGFGAGTGPKSLDVTADGAWQLDVEQMIGASNHGATANRKGNM